MLPTQLEINTPINFADGEVIYPTAKDSFVCFTTDILGLKNPPFLEKLDDILADPAYNKVIAAYPRGHGKSTHLSIAYPLWRIAKDHNLRILIVSSTATTAAGFLRGILNYIEQNEKYQDFCRYCDPETIGVKPKQSKLIKIPERWSSEAITINRSDVTLKDPTIQAVGLFGPIISRRADIIIADDLVNQQNSETDDGRQKIKDWFYTSLLPVLVQPGGQVIYLGNTWHTNDLVQNLLDDPQFDFRQRLQAIVHEADNQELWQEWATIKLNESLEPKERMLKANSYFTAHKDDMMKGIEVLWPEKFSYDFLYLERLANSYAFARMRQCDPSSRPDQNFKEEWLDRAKEKGKSLRLQNEVRDNFTMGITTVGIDLAISLKDKADDTVLLILDKVRFGNDIIKPGDFVVRNIKRGKYTPDVVRRMVKECNDTVKPQGIRVESVAYQEAMVRDLLDLGQVNVRGHKTGRDKNDMELGVNSLAVLAENGQLVIPYDKTDPRTQYLSSKLVDEMRSYPEGHTGDSLMALWFAFIEAKDLTGKRIVIPGGFPTDSYRTGEINVEEELHKADLELIERSSEERQRGVQRGNKRIVF